MPALCFTCFLSIGINYEKLLLFVQPSWCRSVPLEFSNALQSPWHLLMLHSRGVKWILWCNEWTIEHWSWKNPWGDLSQLPHWPEMRGLGLLKYWVQDTRLLSGRVGTLILAFSFFPSMFPPCLFVWRARTHSSKTSTGPAVEFLLRHITFPGSHRGIIWWVVSLPQEENERFLRVRGWGIHKTNTIIHASLETILSLIVSLGSLAHWLHDPSLAAHLYLREFLKVKTSEALKICCQEGSLSDLMGESVQYLKSSQ